MQIKQFPMNLLAGVAALAALSLAGCTKAKPAPSVGFVEHQLMQEDPTVPFHKNWVNPKVDRRKYTKLHVAPVNVAYMLEMTEWQKGERALGGDEMKDDVQKLAEYTRKAIEKAVREDPKKRFTLVDEPTESPDTMVLEVALIEVVPSKVTLNALGYAPMGVGVAIKAVRAYAEDKSSVAFEARTRDASTREVLVMAADRETEQFAPVSVRGLSWYSHAHTIIDNWAQQFVQLSNRQDGEVVADTKAMTLKPW